MSTIILKNTKIMCIFLYIILVFVNLCFTAIAFTYSRGSGFLKTKPITPDGSKKMADVNEHAISKRLVRLYHPTSKDICREGKRSEQLKIIGCQLRAWRIESGISRAALARELGLESELLLFLEMGDAQREDFTNEQLSQLARRVTQSSESREFDAELCSGQGHVAVLSSSFRGK